MVDLNLEMTIRNELPRITYLLEKILTELMLERQNREIEKFRMKESWEERDPNLREDKGLS